MDCAFGPPVKRASTPTSGASFCAVRTDSSTACWRLPAHQNLSSEVKKAGVQSHTTVSAQQTNCYRSRNVSVLRDVVNNGAQRSQTSTLHVTSHGYTARNIVRHKNAAILTRWPLTADLLGNLTTTATSHFRPAAAQHIIFCVSLSPASSGASPDDAFIPASLPWLPISSRGHTILRHVSSRHVRWHKRRSSCHIISCELDYTQLVEFSVRK